MHVIVVTPVGGTTEDAQAFGPFDSQAEAVEKVPLAVALVADWDVVSVLEVHPLVVAQDDSSH